MVEDMTTVAILLPVFNGERFLVEQLESLLRQSFTEWHCFARDDASRDGSVDILQRYAGTHPNRFTLITDDLGNLGTIGCLNELARRVQSPLFALCDQDDVWEEHKLARCVDVLTQLHPRSHEAALAYCDMAVVDERLAPIAPSFWEVARGRRYARGLTGLPVLNVVAGCSMVGNLALLRQAFPVPSCAPMHDVWLGLVAKYAGRHAAVDEPLMLYRQHGRNQCGTSARGSVWARARARLEAWGDYRRQAEATRVRRVAMLETLLERHLPGLRVDACRGALRAEAGGKLRRLVWLLRHHIAPAHAYAYWVV